ncbi:MAG: putative RNase H-like nuclease (RuvC/YqgF family) [Psychroserpens sp.]|jgi:predicted RNase H-like nuclease (RuvC/YqgF family)
MLEKFNSIILDINPIILLTISIIALLLIILNFIKKRKMKGILNRLNNLLEEKEEKIKRLQKELIDYENDSKALQKDIESLKQAHPELNSGNPNEVESNLQEKQLGEDNRVKELFFHKFKDGFFAQKDSSSQFSKNIVYKICLSDNTVGSFTLVNENNSEYIRNKDIFLNSDFCEVRFDNNGSRNKIGNITPGKVHLESDKWMVDEKVQIEIL